MRLTFFTLILFLTGCAMHSPMSEMVMFAEKKVQASIQDSSTVNYNSLFAFSGGLDKSFYEFSTVERIAESRYQTSDGVSVANSLLATANLSVLGSEYFAINIAVSGGMGVDATFKAMEDIYLTVGYTLYGGQQAIIQKRLRYTGRSGLAFGIFYDRVFLGLEESFDCGFCGFGPEDEAYLHVVGIRGLILDHNGQKNRSFLKVYGKTGYMIDYNIPYVTVGASIGIF
ncbi:MAG: hypothetical protein ED557_08810 [Balneola sp.]|nr:MAG: hypothetical protein ED557_08810 [Balneola sp.]